MKGGKKNTGYIHMKSNFKTEVLEVFGTHPEPIPMSMVPLLIAAAMFIHACSPDEHCLLTALRGTTSGIFLQPQNVNINNTTQTAMAQWPFLTQVALCLGNFSHDTLDIRSHYHHKMVVPGFPAGFHLLGGGELKDFGGGGVA